ncbi:unnamed protein product [Knipowitschia caucasica]
MQERGEIWIKWALCTHHFCVLASTPPHFLFVGNGLSFTGVQQWFTRVSQIMLKRELNCEDTGSFWDTAVLFDCAVIVFLHKFTNLSEWPQSKLYLREKAQRHFWVSLS